jgi:transcriptional regulator with XRE-family HTH domain
LDLAQAFGITLKKHRTAAKLSQEKLAELCDIERTYISFLERGLRQPSLSMTFRLAEVFGVKASELIIDVEGKLE